MSRKARAPQQRCSASSTRSVHSVDKPWGAVIASGTSSLPDVRAVCTVLTPAVPAPKNIDELIVVVPGNVCLPNDDLVVAVAVAGHGAEPVNDFETPAIAIY